MAHMRDRALKAVDGSKTTELNTPKSRRMLLRQPNTFFFLVVLQFHTVIRTIIYDY